MEYPVDCTVMHQSSRPLATAARGALDRSYEWLLGAMRVSHAGVMHITAHVDEYNAIHPVSLALWLNGESIDQPTLLSASPTPLDGPHADVSEHFYQPDQPAHNAIVAGAVSVFVATAGISQHLTAEMASCLQDMLQGALRSVAAARYLDSILPANSAVADRIVKSFDRSGIGLRVQVEHFETPLEPGSPIATRQGDSAGNLVIATAPELDEWAAFAESMTAMHLLLSTIELEMASNISASARPRTPEAIRPEKAYLDGGFRSYPDSWTFSAGVRQARELIGEPGNPVGLIDLGCGSAAPMIEALVDGSIDCYIGVDLDQQALRQAQLNLATVNQDCYRIDQLDVTQRDAAARIKSHMVRFPVNTIWILGANLPYLPTPEEGVLDRATDGGRRGLDLMPRFPLALATDLGSELVVLNVSSLCDLDGFLDEVDATPFLARRFIGTVAPLEAYARKVVDYVRTQRIGRPYDSYQAQIICAYVLQRASGISAKKAMTYLERLLATPTLQPDLAVACGDSSGEVTIFTPVRPLACRSLSFSVARSARDHAGEM